MSRRGVRGVRPYKQPENQTRRYPMLDQTPQARAEDYNERLKQHHARLAAEYREHPVAPDRRGGLPGDSMPMDVSDVSDLSTDPPPMAEQLRELLAENERLREQNERLYQAVLMGGNLQRQYKAALEQIANTDQIALGTSIAVLQGIARQALEARP